MLRDLKAQVAPVHGTDHEHRTEYEIARNRSWLHHAFARWER
jgi:hypothetical protein